MEVLTFANHIRVGDQIKELAKNLDSFVLTLCLHLHSNSECLRDVLLKELGIQSVDNLY